jgi:hypothetical protein
MVQYVKQMSAKQLEKESVDHISIDGRNIATDNSQNIIVKTKQGKVLRLPNSKNLPLPDCGATDVDSESNNSEKTQTESDISDNESDIKSAKKTIQSPVGKKGKYVKFSSGLSDSESENQLESSSVNVKTPTKGNENVRVSTRILEKNILPPRVVEPEVDNRKPLKKRAYSKRKRQQRHEEVNQDSVDAAERTRTAALYNIQQKMSRMDDVTPCNDYLERTDDFWQNTPDFFVEKKTQT